MTSSDRRSHRNDDERQDPPPQSAGETPQGPPDNVERRCDEDRRQSVVDRRSGAERRSGGDRRKGGERRSGKDRRAEIPDLYRRRGPGIRRPEDRRAAEEGQMTDEQWEFLQAIDEYKRVNNKPFPTWTEVLEVIKKLGYHKDPIEEPPTP